MCIRAGVALAVPLFLGAGSSAMAASPEYCAVYAHASADPQGAASASADDTDALKRAYDKAYYECLNLDDEPKLPVDFADRGLDNPGVGEGDLSVDDEKVIKPEKKASAKIKKTASIDKPAKRKKWKSGYEAWTPEWSKWCEANYKSFDPKTGTYNSYSGEQKFCR